MKASSVSVGRERDATAGTGVGGVALSPDSRLLREADIRTPTACSCLRQDGVQGECLGPRNRVGQLEPKLVKGPPGSR
jgi:hypothetical protein